MHFKRCPVSLAIDLQMTVIQWTHKMPGISKLGTGLVSIFRGENVAGGRLFCKCHLCSPFGQCPVAEAFENCHERLVMLMF